MFSKKAAADKGQTKLPFAPLHKAGDKQSPATRDSPMPRNDPKPRNLPWGKKPEQSQNGPSKSGYWAGSRQSGSGAGAAEIADAEPQSGWKTTSKVEPPKKRKFEYDDGYGEFDDGWSENKSRTGKGKTTGGISKEQRAEDANLAAILKLSDEQKVVLGWVAEHRGTGKSFLLRQIIKDLKRLHGKDAVAVCGRQFASLLSATLTDTRQHQRVWLR
ncbi:hypothetical protein DFJ74DRAFT_644119 [Hyaloraphidium curvatum]|nr:hypothetical protein DFJ74DRAFT_644119 [Hyaloraphidium curvatum]